MDKIPDTNYPIHTLALFRQHVLAFPAFEGDEGWVLNTRNPGFAERIARMKALVTQLLSHHDDGTLKNEDELPSPEKISMVCQSTMAQALDYFRKRPSGTQFSCMLPLRTEDGAVDWQWVMVYNEALFRDFSPGAPCQTIHEPRALLDALEVMGAKGDPVEALRQQVAKQTGVDLKEVNLDDLVRDGRSDLFATKSAEDSDSVEALSEQDGARSVRASRDPMGAYTQEELDAIETPSVRFAGGKYAKTGIIIDDAQWED